ncbi:MAG: UTP--glucose-1-phosphate uridylyltransferase [Phycisphaerae bacterium]
MKQSIESRYEAAKRAFEQIGQAHVFTFWDELDPIHRERLLDDLETISVRQLPGLSKRVTSSAAAPSDSRDLTPAEVIPCETVTPDVIEQGRSLLTDGKVAALTVAGGQGTRLGFNGPKGAFKISPVRNKPLFQLFAEAILATERRYGSRIPWYVMTSPANDKETRNFFKQRDYFGLDSSRITFFRQGVMPAFDRAGRVLLEDKHRITLAPDGHGGTLLALATSGALAKMADRGIEQISYFQVDNPLVTCLDPAFIGLHARRGSEMSSKTSPKADDLERVGNFVMADGRLNVIEYSDLPESLARQRNPDGTRRFNAANLAIHILSRSFVQRLTSDRAAFALPWHVAHKKATHVELNSGRRVEPKEPNAIKLESFIFDALPLAENPILMGVARSEEFSPVKNATGVDSVETARRDMSRHAANWLEATGQRIPRDATGNPLGQYEISPLAALDVEELKQRLAKGDLSPEPTPATSGDWYLGD